MESRENPSYCQWRYPKIFKFYGLKYSEIWEELDSHDGTELSTAATLINFPITRIVSSYSAFKINIEQCGGPGSWSAISRFEIDGDFVQKNDAPTCRSIRASYSVFIYVIFILK
jgi:hypothetical protein